MKTPSSTFVSKALAHLRGIWKERHADIRKAAQRRSFFVEALEPRAMLASDLNLLTSPLVGPTDPGSNYVQVAPTNTGSSNSLIAHAPPQSEAAQDLVAFAKALTASGAKLYGAAWSAPTTAQKEIFQDGAIYLPFAESSNPDRTPNSVATTNNITTYPTWILGNSTRLVGQQTLAQLATASGIAIPTGTNPTVATIYDSTATSGNNGNINVLGGSPLFVGLDGYDPAGNAITYTATVSNQTGGLNLQATVPTGNKSLLIDTAGYGKMTFQLHENLAPRATTAISTLANNGFYNGLTFHRVFSNFVNQGGSRTGDGAPDPTVADFDDQFNNNLMHNQSGVLSMAKGNDDTNDTQFFITASPQRHLDFNHSIFGQLTEGDLVRAAINAAPGDSSGKPNNTITINTVSVFTDTENGLLKLSAPEGASGSADVTLTATDSMGNVTTRIYRVVVAADTVGSNPYLSDITAPTTTSGTGVDTTLVGIDADGTTNNFYFDAVKNNGSDNYILNVNHNTGVVTFVPGVGVTGTFSYTASVRDSSSTLNPVDSQKVTVTVNASAPSAPDLVDASDSGSSATDNITNLTAVNFQLTGLISGATVKLYAGNTVIATTTATGTSATILVSNLASLGEVTTSFSASQTVNSIESAKSPVLAVTYDVTAPGAITSVAPTTGQGNVVYSYNAQSPNEGAAGVTYSLLTPPTGMSVNASTGVVSWTPTADQVGANSYGLRVQDAAGNTSATQTVNVTVAAAVVPKVDFKLRITNSSGQVVTSLHVGDTFNLVGSVQDLRAAGTGVFSFYSDISFDSAKAIVNGPIVLGTTYAPSSGSVPSSVTATPGLLDELGSFSQSLGNLSTGVFTLFTVPMRVTGAGQIRFTSAPATADVSVLGENAKVTPEFIKYGTAAVSVDLPFAATNDTLVVSEDVTGATLNVLANDTITVGSGVTLTITGVTPAAHGTVTIAADGKSLLYTPSPNYNGSESFSYTVTSQAGDSATADVALTVQNVNDPPTAGSDTFDTTEDVKNFSLNVLSNDSSSPDLGENLTVQSFTAGNRGGVLALGPNAKSLLYTPAANFSGTETFSYTISDGNGGTATASITINVAAVNDPPTATNDSASVVEDSTGNHVNVIANDSFAPDLNETVTVTAVGAPSQGGTVTIGVGGVDVLYTPKANFFGTETFTYTISDGNGGTAVGTVTMTVTNTNDAPTANADDVLAYKNTAVPLDLLANDSFLPDPVEVLTIDSVTQPAHGTVTITNNGTKVQYSPVAGYTGPDSFTYIIRDAGGLTSAATTVNVTVKEFIPSFLSGFAFLDTNGSGTKDSGDAMLAGITVTLTGTDSNSAPVSKTVTTGSDGSYRFINLAPGTYKLTETQPAFLVDGAVAVGSQGGQASAANEISIQLSQDTNGVNNNFSEKGRQVQNYATREFFASTWRSQVIAAINTSTSGASSSGWHSLSGTGWSQYTQANFTLTDSNTKLKIDVTNAQAQTLTSSVLLTDKTHVLDLGVQGSQRLVRLIGSPSNFNFQVIPGTSSSSSLGSASGESGSRRNTSNLLYPTGNQGLNNQAVDAALGSTSNWLN